MNIFKLIYKVLMTVLAFVTVFFPILFAKLSDERGYYNLALALAYVPFFFGEKLRYYFYRYTLPKCGSKIMFKFGSCCLYRDVELYDNITIGLFTMIGKCTIEENVLLGSHVNITSGNQQHIVTMNEGDAVLTDGKRERVIIGKNVWVGNNAVILKNIARNCIIGAGAVVTRPTEKNGIYVGNPAKYLRDVDAI